jgi:hypothetical protein
MGHKKGPGRFAEAWVDRSIQRRRTNLLTPTGFEPVSRP